MEHRSPSSQKHFHAVIELLVHDQKLFFSEIGLIMLPYGCLFFWSSAGPPNTGGATSSMMCVQTLNVELYRVLICTT